MENIHNAMKFGTQQLIINMIFEIANPNPKFLKDWADLVSTSKMLIINVLMMTLTEN